MSIKVDHGKRSRQIDSTRYLSIIVNRQVKLSIKVDNHKVFNWLLICRHKQESKNAALCNDRSVGDWMFNISKKYINIKHKYKASHHLDVK